MHPGLLARFCRPRRDHPAPVLRCRGKNLLASRPWRLYAGGVHGVQMGQSDALAGGAPSSSTSRSTPQPSAAAWQEWFDARRQQVDAAISDHLKTLKNALASHSHLAQAVQYSMSQGGKRVRPVLVLETCRVCGGADEVAMPAAIAIECVHTFSLIHDDLPAMDDDDLRRGQPSSHKVFGEALAILAGDWLLAHAFNLLSSDRVDTRLSAVLTQTLAFGTEGMIAGQAADIQTQGLAPDGELVKFIHGHKTARLIEAACRMGACCARASDQQVEDLGRFGRHLGLAFQIVDDLLDCTGSTATLGKRVRKDTDVRKQTYPAAFGLERSRAQAEREIDTALTALEAYGCPADNLRGLARFVLARDR